MFLTTTGTDRQQDADILAKCLLAARTKGKDRQPIWQAHRRLPDPLSAVRPDQHHPDRDGQARQGDVVTRPIMRLKTKIDELRADPRYSFMFSGMLVADTMAGFLAQDLPAAEPGQADLDRRRLGRAFRHHLGRGRGALPPDLRFRDLGARRGAAPDPAGLRGGAPLRPEREERGRSSARSSSGSPRKAVNTASASA